MINKSIVTILLATFCVSAEADQIVFSKYDGNNTFFNTFVDTEDAQGFADANPGVAFVEAQPEVSDDAVEGVEEIVAVEGEYVYKNIRNNQVFTWIQPSTGGKFERNGKRKPLRKLKKRVRNQSKLKKVSFTRRVEGVAGVEAKEAIQESSREALAVVVVGEGETIQEAQDRLL